MENKKTYTVVTENGPVTLTAEEATEIAFMVEFNRTAARVDEYIDNMFANIDSRYDKASALSVIEWYNIPENREKTIKAMMWIPDNAFYDNDLEDTINDLMSEVTREA